MYKLIMPILNIGNAITRRLLRSRLHWLLSHSVVMLEIVGRRSGKTYLVPVNYKPFDGGVSVMTYRRRHWWLNLKDVDQLQLWFKGTKVAVRPELVTEDLDAIQQGLTERGWARKAVVPARAKESVLIRLHWLQR